LWEFFKNFIVMIYADTFRSWSAWMRACYDGLISMYDAIHAASWRQCSVIMTSMWTTSTRRLVLHPTDCPAVHMQRELMWWPHLQLLETVLVSAPPAVIFTCISKIFDIALAFWWCNSYVKYLRDNRKCIYQLLATFLHFFLGINLYPMFYKIWTPCFLL